MKPVLNKLISKPIFILLAVNILIIQQRSVLSQGLVQPRLIHLVIAHLTVKPLVGYFVSHYPFQERASWRSSHLTVRVIQTNQDGDNAGVFVGVNNMLKRRYDNECEDLSNNSGQNSFNPIIRCHIWPT